MKKHQVTAAAKHVKLGHMKGFFKVFNDKSARSSDLFLEPLGGSGKHSALYLACTNNRLRFVEYIHDKYFDAVIEHFIGKSVNDRPLAWAIESGSFDVALCLFTEYAANYDDALTHARHWFEKIQAEETALTQDVERLQANLINLQYDFKTTKLRLPDPTLANLALNDLAEATCLMATLEDERVIKEQKIQILTQEKYSLYCYHWFSSGDKQYRAIEEAVDKLEKKIIDIKYPVTIAG